MPEGFDRGRHGLAPVRAETWHDWIFVNLNGAAPALEDFIAPLRRRIGGLDLTRLHHLVTIDFGEIAANWKLLVENFIAPYHVQFVHSTTTEQPLADHYTINDPGCLGCGVDVSGDATRKDTLSEDSRFLTLFPNFVLGAYLPDQIGVHLEVPVAPDRTLQRRAIYSLKSEPEPARRAQQLAKLWRAVHRRGPRHARAASTRARVRGGVRRRRALSGVGNFGAELSGARGQTPAMNPGCDQTTRATSDARSAG